jgi:dTDP-4-dehydrorhamnose 3,5-epimerase
VKFTATPLPGTYVIDLEPAKDERGFFARQWCAEEFRQLGLNASLAQCSISFTTKKGTLRGMHFQAEPHAEAKLVRCTAGAIYDVALDLRPHSATRGEWFAVELTAANRSSLYVPEGVAHGFQALVDDCEVYYQISESYCREFASGVRWNDPAFSIRWPIAGPILSEHDSSWPDYQP